MKSLKIPLLWRAFQLIDHDDLGAYQIAHALVNAKNWAYMSN